MADELALGFILISFLSLGECSEVSGLEIVQCERDCEYGVLLSTNCKRGCRFFSMINLINDFPDINDTLIACKSACDEAYNLSEGRSSCYAGCQAELPHTQAYRQRLEVLKAPLDYYASPFAYMNQLYADMVGRVHSQVSVSWSVYVQPDRGTMVIIRAEPAVQLPDLNLEYGEAKAGDVEASLMERDSANVDSMKASPVFWKGRSVALAPGGNAGDAEVADWLACVSRRTGIPRMLLSFLLIVSSVTIVWLCLATSVTTSDRHQPLEKLKIHFDLNYLHSSYRDSDATLPYLTKTKAQDVALQAAPLPLKIRLDTV